MGFGVVIIGDEILSGRRQDKHLVKAIELLGARGLRLGWARYLGDDRPGLVQLLRESLQGGDVVFSFGGIGATPDDHTRQAAALAAGAELALHPQAEREIRARFGEETTAQRLQMGVFPVGSRIIPNPYNRIPGFSVGKLHCLPGFPVMAWPMMAWVLDEQYAHLHHRDDYVECALTVWDVYEGQLIDLMETLTARFPAATLFSLPTLAGPGQRRSLELGTKGPAAAVAESMACLEAALRERGIAFEPRMLPAAQG